MIYDLRIKYIVPQNQAKIKNSPEIAEGLF